KMMEPEASNSLRGGSILGTWMHDSRVTALDLGDGYRGFMSVLLDFDHGGSTLGSKKNGSFLKVFGLDSWLEGEVVAIDACKPDCDVEAWGNP
ncbi:hypothetical protein U1Q18_025874, partial [Sarracenia purpurea var. burkii]